MPDYPTTRSDPQEVKTAFQILTNYIQELKQDSPAHVVAERRYRQHNVVSYALLFLAFVAAGVGVVFPASIWWWWYATFIVLAVCMAFYANVTLVRKRQDIWQGLTSPRQPFLNLVERSLDIEEAYLDQLLTLDRPALVLAHARLEQAVEQRRDRTEALFGLVSKVGLFPALLASGVALIPALKSSGNNIVLVLITALLFLNHNAAFEQQMALLDVRSMLALLKRAITLERATATASSEAPVAQPVI